MPLDNTTASPVLAPPPHASCRHSLTGLDFLWLEITGKCNLECVHCYADSSPRGSLYGKMSAADWLAVIDDAADAGCRQLQFIGGEPTLHPDLDAMIRRARERNYALIEVYTNATALTERRLALFQEMGVSLATSFYSYNARTHEKITKGPGSFARTVMGIEAATRKGLPVRVGLVHMQGINDHDRPGSIAFLHGLGATMIGEDWVRDIGRGSKQTGMDATSDAYFGSLCGQCWKGKLCVTPDGSAYPCVFSRKSCVGDVREQRLSEILASRGLLETRDLIRRKTERGEDLPTEAAVGRCHPEGVMTARGPEGTAAACTPDSTMSACTPESTLAACAPEGVMALTGPVASRCAPEGPMVARCHPEGVMSACPPASTLAACAPEGVMAARCHPEGVMSACPPASTQAACAPEGVMAATALTGPIASRCAPEGPMVARCHPEGVMSACPPASTLAAGAPEGVMATTVLTGPIASRCAPEGPMVARCHPEGVMTARGPTRFGAQEAGACPPSVLGTRGAEACPPSVFLDATGMPRLDAAAQGTPGGGFGLEATRCFPTYPDPAHAPAQGSLATAGGCLPSSFDRPSAAWVPSVLDDPRSDAREPRVLERASLSDGGPPTGR
jgi:MoaA/NifB/PqqE/SkfB family radical SAM enzyme